MSAALPAREIMNPPKLETRKSKECAKLTLCGRCPHGSARQRRIAERGVAQADPPASSPDAIEPLQPSWNPQSIRRLQYSHGRFKRGPEPFPRLGECPGVATIDFPAAR